MKNKKSADKILTYAILILVLFISLFPILYPLFSSFRTDNELFANMAPFSWKTIFPIDWTLENYIAIFREYDFLRYLKNTLIMIIVTVPCTIAICALAAYAFAFYNFRFKKQLFTMFLLTFMIPGEAIALPMYSLVNSMGLVNTYAGLILPALANGLVLFPVCSVFSVRLQRRCWNPWRLRWRMVDMFYKDCASFVKTNHYYSGTYDFCDSVE